MSEKQTYTQGPETETHIDINKSKKFVRRALGTGAVLGAGIATAVSAFAGAAGNHHEAAPAPEPSATSHAVEKPQFITDTVEQGDSLWGIAEKAYPDQDTQDVIKVIESSNESTLDHGLQPGLILKIPAEFGGEAVHSLDVPVESATQKPVETHATPETKPTEEYIVTRVGEGDSIEAVGSIYYPDLSEKKVVSAIEAANPDKDPNEFYAWGSAKIPEQIGNEHAIDVGE